ncbi:RDD family protein [Enhygromyxa salina]|uniref:RDD family protein n=1 Tax=Enhygromyxa salina TaxID=215803 RepID=A0A2S9YQQ3_9BACT|nr:RDD family protein [Enhygromyxa salina]PRQ07410.1 RDD family protein [Enhygromyxa salina]
MSIEQPATDPVATPIAAPVERAPKRVPIRRRPMPCPHCDAELDRELAAAASAACPHCSGPLLPVEVAGFWRRCAAGLVDLALLTVTAGPIAWGLHRLIGSVSLAPGARGLDFALTVFATDLSTLLLRAGPILVLAGLYLMISVAWSGRTLGQRLVSVRIVDRHGQPPSVLIAGLRTLAQLAGTLAAALGPAWIAFSSERRAIHDLVSGTYVVRAAKVIRAAGVVRSA